MQIGDLVTWKSDVLNEKAPLDYGVVTDFFRSSKRNNRCVWVKFASGVHAHRERTLCSIDHLILVKDIKQKRT